MPEFNGQRLTNIGSPIFGKDSVNLDYLNYKLANFTGGTTGGTVTGNYLPLSGGTISGTTNFNNGAVIQSGGTDLYSIFSTGGGGGASTFVQPGNNIYTGGTSSKPVINLVDSPSVNNFSFSGKANGVNLYATNLSGGTIYSGSTDINSLFADKIHTHSQYATLSGANFTGSIQSGGTDLYNIFLNTADGNDITRVQPGSNITTGGTGNLPVVSVVASPIFNNITFSGTAIGNALSATTISGGTLYSGSTNLYDIILELNNTFSTSAITSSTGYINPIIDYYGVNYNGNVDIGIPSATGLDGLNFTIKDEGGNAKNHRIRITPDSGLIDGDNYVDMKINYMALNLLARGGNWWII